MFKIAQLPSYWQTVDVEMKQENGSTQVVKFEVKFKRHTATELKELQERSERGELKDRDLLHDIVLDWKDVGDEQGQVKVFEREAFDALLEVHPVQPSMVRAFFKSIGSARLGN